MLTLSPLNRRGLFTRLAGCGSPEDPRRPKVERREKPFEVIAWECWTCSELHRDEEDAEACCQGPGEPAQREAERCECPVCGSDYFDAYDAADCCLWRDLAKDVRERAADQVEAGSTWLEALASVAGGLSPEFEHLRLAHAREQESNPKR